MPDAAELTGIIKYRKIAFNSMSLPAFTVSYVFAMTFYLPFFITIPSL